MLSATWERWEVEGRGVPELLPWVAEGGDRCFGLVDFEVRFKSLRQSQVVLKGCNIAKKIRCNMLKEGGIFAQRSTEKRRASHHTTVCVPRGGLNSPTSDATKSAVLPPRLTDGSSRHPRPDRSPNQSGSSGLNSPKSEWTCTKSAGSEAAGLHLALSGTAELSSPQS